MNANVNILNNGDLQEICKEAMYFYLSKSEINLFLNSTPDDRSRDCAKCAHIYYYITF